MRQVAHLIFYVRNTKYPIAVMAADNIPSSSFIHTNFFIDNPASSVKIADCIIIDNPPNPSENEVNIRLHREEKTDDCENVFAALVTSTIIIIAEEI